jgi:hypothetical protein
VAPLRSRQEGRGGTVFEEAEGGVILPLCILCDSEATVADGGKLVICRQCGQYRLVQGLAAELTKESDWPELQSDLARAVRWRFYQGEPVTLSGNARNSVESSDSYVTHSTMPSCV